MKKTHTILNRHQLLNLAALQGWLEHNLDPVQRADQLLTLRPEELNCIFDTLPIPQGAELLGSLSAESAGRLLQRLHGSIVSVLQEAIPRRDMVAILRKLGRQDRTMLLARFPTQAQAMYYSLLDWPTESVGQHAPRISGGAGGGHGRSRQTADPRCLGQCPAVSPYLCGQWGWSSAREPLAQDLADRRPAGQRCDPDGSGDCADQRPCGSGVGSAPAHRPRPVGIAGRGSGATSRYFPCR